MVYTNITSNYEYKLLFNKSIVYDISLSLIIELQKVLQVVHVHKSVFALPRSA